MDGGPRGIAIDSLARRAYVTTEDGLAIIDLLPLRLQALGWSSAGGFRFSICGQPGVSVQLQRSANLRDWADWGAPFTLGTASTERADSEAASANQYFYRAVTRSNP